MKYQQAVHVFATWKIKEGQLDQVLKLLKIVRNESSKEKGNLFYKIHQSHTEPNTIVLFEGYIDQDAVTIHRDTPHFKNLVLGKIVPLLEHREILLTTPLEIE